MANKKKIEDIYQHFSSSEKDFVEKMIGVCQQVEERYAYHLTAFLNPREEEILQSLAGYFQLVCYSSRQLLETEFCRVIIAPDYYVLNEDDFLITAFEISYPRKFHHLSHSQILGTLLNQLGIRREFIGDIFVDEEEAFVLLDKKFGELARSSISKIARVPVSWEEQDLSSLPIKRNKEPLIRDFLLSSLRLDKVIATGFGLSRSTALKLIDAGHVKLDYQEVKQASKIIGIGQLVSVRGFGRLRLKELLGYSKQGKLKVEFEIINK